MLHFSSIYASIFDLTLLFSQCVLHALIEMCEYYVICSVFVCGCVCDFIHVYVFMCGRRKWMFAFLSTPKYEFLILMLLCYYSYALLLLLLLLLYKKNRLYVIVMIFVVCIFYYYYYHSHSFLFNACQRSLSQSTVRCGGIRISNDCIFLNMCIHPHVVVVLFMNH